MKETQTGGGVVIGPAGKVLVVNQNGLSWSLPKGHIDPGEDAKKAAVREIKEESGISKLKFLKELGSYKRHKIGLDPNVDDKSELKNITMFLFITSETELAPEDPDNPEARWVDINDVAKLLTHPKDKAFFEDIKSEIHV